MSIFETRDLEDADVPFFDFGFTQQKAVLPADLLQSKMHRRRKKRKSARCQAVGPTRAALRGQSFS